MSSWHQASRVVVKLAATLLLDLKSLEVQTLDVTQYPLQQSEL
jgi:hypothetical protein